MEQSQSDREFMEKARSVGFVNKYKPGRKVKKPVENQIDGSNAGYHVEHYDGHQDAVITPPTITSKSTIKE